MFKESSDADSPISERIKRRLTSKRGSSNLIDSKRGTPALNDGHGGRSKRRSTQSLNHGEYDHDELIKHVSSKRESVSKHTKRESVTSRRSSKTPRKSRSASTLSSDVNEDNFFKPIKYDDSDDDDDDVNDKLNRRRSKRNILNDDRKNIPAIQEPSMSSSESIPVVTNDHRKSNLRQLQEPSSTDESGDGSKKGLLNIVEFDRSDISSDSEPESTRNFREARQRRRTRASRWSRSSMEAEEAKKEATPPPVEESVINKQKKRRCGVSAEPVRVSWSQLRSQMMQKQEEPMNNPEDSRGEIIYEESAYDNGSYYQLVRYKFLKIELDFVV